MKAVIYARYSSSKQREASIEDQLRICREWCDREGYEVVNEYCDRAISGRTDDRPAFQAMVSNAGESDIVLVYMMDRFSRDPYDAPAYKKRFRDAGVDVVSATEPISDGAESILIEKIFEGLAAVESVHISQRTRRGMEGNARKAMHNGVPVFGYSFGDDGRYQVDPVQADVVRECFERRLDGESVNSIADDLAHRGIRTTTGRPASHTFVNTMLHNRKYTGLYSWGDVTIPDGIPRIIDDELFAAVQGVRGRKVRALEQWRDYPLSGGKGLCVCGNHLAGVSTKKGDRRYHYYRCTCGNRIRADVLEDAVVSCVRGFLDDRENALQVARDIEKRSMNTGTAAKLEDALKRRDEAEKGIRNMLDAVAKGLRMELAKPKLDELESDLDRAIRDAAMYESMCRFDVEDFADFLQFGATLDDRAVLDCFVSRVTLGDDVTVTLSYTADGEARYFRAKRSTNPTDEVGTDYVWLPGHQVLPNRRLLLAVNV